MEYRRNKEEKQTPGEVGVYHCQKKKETPPPREKGGAVVEINKPPLVEGVAVVVECKFVVKKIPLLRGMDVVMMGVMWC